MLLRRVPPLLCTPCGPDHKGWENETADFQDFGNCPAASMTGGAFELASLPVFKTVDNSSYRLPRTAVPVQNNRTVLFMGARGYDDQDIITPLEKALAAGKLDPAALLADGVPNNCSTKPPQEAH